MKLPSKSRIFRISQAYLKTRLGSRRIVWQISLSGRISLYSRSTICMSAATASLLFFPNLCERKSRLLFDLIMRAASSLYGKLGRFSWHDIVLSVVNHSLRVSESFWSQLENHSGVHSVKSLGVFTRLTTRPHSWHTISPFGSLGETSFPRHSGHFNGVFASGITIMRYYEIKAIWRILIECFLSCYSSLS